MKASDAQRITLQATFMRDAIDALITEAARYGERSVTVLRVRMPDTLEIELVADGFQLTLLNDKLHVRISW